MALTKGTMNVIENLLENEMQQEFEYQKTNNVPNLERLVDYVSAYIDVVKANYESQPLIQMELIKWANELLKKFEREK